MLYLVLFIFIALFGVTDILDTPSGFRKTALVGIGILFITLGSLRWTTGTDWPSYFRFFNTNTTLDQFILNPTFEIGFGLLNYIIRVFTPNFTYLLTVMAIVSIGLKLKFIGHYSEAVFLTLLCYFSFYLGDIFAVRQSMSLGLSLFATSYLLNRKFFIFLLLLSIAGLLHNSAFLFLPSYWVVQWRPSATKILIWVGVALVIGYSPLMSWVVGLLVKVLANTRIGGKLTYYFLVESDVSGSSISEASASVVGLLKRLVILPLLLLIPPKLETKQKEFYTSLLSLFVFGNIVYFLFNKDLRVMQRGAIYYLQYEMILLPYLLYAFKNQAVIVYSFLVLYCGSKLYYSLLAYWDLYVPYISIFSGVERITY